MAGRDADHGKPQPQFVSPETFAELTGLSVHTVRTMLRNHRLAATQTSKGGVWLIPVSELERLHAEAQAWRRPDDDDDEDDQQPSAQG